MGINARGASGAIYNFSPYSMSGKWHDIGVVYMFAYLGLGNRWNVLYIGQADSAKKRLPSHERWDEAAKKGATHVLALVVADEANRLTIERDLIASHQPALNTHHVGTTILTRKV